MTGHLEVELAEPRREVVEVVELGERVLYVVEPAIPPAVPRALSDLDDVASDVGFDGQVLTLVDGVWTPVNPGGVGGAHTAAGDPHPQYLTTADGDGRYGNLFKEAEQDGRLDTLEARPVIDSPDDIGAQPVGDYATNGALTTGLAGKANTGHGHALADITGLVAGLAEKADTSVTDSLDNRVDVLEALPIVNSPDDIGAQPAGSYATDAELAAGLATKADDGHTHVIADTTGLQAALDGKSATGHTHSTPARVVSTPVALVDQATITTDAALGNTFRVTLAGNRTLAAPTNPADGQRCLWEFTQDGTGNRTITLTTTAGGFAFGSDITAFVLSTTAGKTDVLGAEYHAGRDRWLVLATAKGY